MTDDIETTEGVEHPSLLHADAFDPDESTRGKVLQTFLVRVTLRENTGPSTDPSVEAEIPTNEVVEDIVATAFYDALPYFHEDSINATAEKV